jgi:hypothetical protein
MSMRFLGALPASWEPSQSPPARLRESEERGLGGELLHLFGLGGSTLEGKGLALGFERLELLGVHLGYGRYVVVLPLSTEPLPPHPAFSKGERATPLVLSETPATLRVAAKPL